MLGTHSSTRACKQCALDRVRCSRTLPCKRCSKRNLPCCFPATGRSAKQGDPCERGDLQSTESRISNPTTLLATAITNLDENQITSQTELQIASSTEMLLHNAASCDHGADHTMWNATLGDVVTLCDVDLPNLGPLGINWISPGYQYDPDWNLIPNDGIGTTQYYRLEQQTHLHLSADETCQRSHGFTPSLDTSISGDSAQTPQTSGSIGGEYYVDGDGPRAPFGGRSHARGSVIHGQTPSKIRSPTGPALSSQSYELCSLEAYNKLVDECTPESNTVRLDAGRMPFPSHSQVELYVQRYFDNFNPIYPFLRRATVREISSTEWLLLLAVAVIGSRYVSASQQSCDILARTLDAAIDSRLRVQSIDSPEAIHNSDAYVPGRLAQTNTSTSLHTLQSGILHMVYLLQLGKQSSINKALRMRHYLADMCHSMKLLESGSCRSGDPACSTSSDLNDWLASEEKIRTGMMLWVRSD